jgi:hypothetical protein
LAVFVVVIVVGVPQVPDQIALIIMQGNTYRLIVDLGLYDSFTIVLV